MNAKIWTNDPNPIWSNPELAQTKARELDSMQVRRSSQGLKLEGVSPQTAEVMQILAGMGCKTATINERRADLEDLTSKFGFEGSEVVAKTVILGLWNDSRCWTRPSPLARLFNKVFGG